MMENSKGVDCIVRMFGKTGLVYVRETREHGSNVRIGSTDVLSGKFKRLHREKFGVRWRESGVQDYVFA